MKGYKYFLRDKNLLIIGMGKTGISVVSKMYGICNSITAVDSNPDLDLKDDRLKKIKNKNFKLILDKNINRNRSLLNNIDIVIVSPGVSDEIPLIKYAESLKIPIWSELELAWMMMTDKDKAGTIAVTGTNGKTTVVTLIGEILRDFGIRVEVCGNIGIPVIETIDDKSNLNYVDYVDKIRVMEVSSFQLERIYSFKPYIGIILNITSDHIDRHRSMKNYIDLKFKLFSNQSSSDYSVVNMDDENITRKLEIEDFVKTIKSNLIGYSLDLKKRTCLWYENNNIFYNIKGISGKIDIKDIFLQGAHNISNIMAAVAAAKLYGVDDKNLENTIKNFKPLDHRLQYLGVVGKIRCYNDSKSTNPDATIKALYSFEKEVTLILGGQDKDMNFEALIPAMNQKVNNLILIGQSAPKIYKTVAKSYHNFKIYKCRSLEEAVEVGFKVTPPGQVLLLSPSCASMDMFKNYVERGEKFKNLVMEKKLEKME